MLLIIIKVSIKAITPNNQIIPTQSTIKVKSHTLKILIIKINTNHLWVYQPQPCKILMAMINIINDKWLEIKGYYYVIIFFRTNNTNFSLKLFYIYIYSCNLFKNKLSKNSSENFKNFKRMHFISFLIKFLNNFLNFRPIIILFCW
jgi:hypothetical protein